MGTPRHSRHPLVKRKGLCHKSRVKQAWLSLIVFCAGLSLPCLCPPVRAQGNAAFVLQSLSVIARDGQTRLEAAVAVNNMAALQASLAGGAALNLNLKVRLEKTRHILPDSKVEEHDRLYQLRFDPLTREYLLLSRDSPALRHQRLEDLLTPVLADLVFPLASSGALTPDAPYRVSLTLAVRYAHVPSWLKPAILFWSGDVIVPATFRLDFVPAEQSPDTFARETEHE